MENYNLGISDVIFEILQVFYSFNILNFDSIEGILFTITLIINFFYGKHCFNNLFIL